MEFDHDDFQKESVLPGISTGKFSTSPKRSLDDEAYLSKVYFGILPEPVERETVQLGIPYILKIPKNVKTYWS